MLCYWSWRQSAPRFAVFPFFSSSVDLMSHINRFVVAATFLSLLAAQANAEGGDPALGQRLAQEWCAKCHAIGLVDKSPLAIAPAFRDLHKRYDVEDLEESFAEGILVGHPTMPVFRFDPDQINNLIAYLKTLEKPRD